MTIGDWIRYSAVCGVGVDMVLLRGDVAATDLVALLRDVSALSERLTKPLCVRVLPVPGLKVGERTSLDVPCLCDFKVLNL